MPLIQYQERRFSRSSRAVINSANEIIHEYAAQGFDLTLRQLYYQFVARGIIPNKQSEYKRLGSLVNDARLAGLIDWNSIVDRTRNLRSIGHWNSPSQIVHACAGQFQLDRWEDQENYVEVWIEKDALIGVIAGVCNQYDVPHFSCRGYVSQSEMWGAAQRLLKHRSQRLTILHFGDHDPSGIDMTRDIEERLAMFGADVVVERLALTMDQVKQYNPPPNPAKLTDSRCEGYMHQYGEESWELDALDPATLSGLIERRLLEKINVRQWRQTIASETEAREQLQVVAEHWDEAAEYVQNL